MQWLFLQETAISNAWYEVLSVLHLMAMLSLSQANLLLLPRTSADGYHSKVSEGRFQAHLETCNGEVEFIISSVDLGKFVKVYRGSNVRGQQQRLSCVLVSSSMF